MKKRFDRIAVSALILAALAAAPWPALAEEPNPFFSKSTLQYQTPPFDKIKDSDYAPAIDEGMKQQIAEVEAIANQQDPPTFDNTIVPLERSGELLTRVTKVFFNLAQSNTNEAIQKIQADEAPKLSAHQDAIFQNPKLFARVQALYDRRESLGLDAESKYLVERYEKFFIRAGANLGDEDKAKLRALNKEEATLSTQFQKKLLADTNAAAVVVNDRSDLSGMSDADIEAAGVRAKARGLEGKWLLNIRNTTQQPVLASLENRAFREKVLASSQARCDHGGQNDTTAIDARLAQLRAQKAKLLGFPNSAAYILDDEMARTPANAEKLLTDIVPAATARAKAEAARMQKIVDADKGGFKVGAADWQFYSEKVRKADYGLDDAKIRPYFELDRVLHDGIFYAANKLYGLTFRERRDLPVYNPDVRVFEVFDADGSSLALFYGDYFSRPNKSGGAWDDSFVDQSSLFGTRPVIVNVLNFTKPAPGQPALLTFDDVTGLFHEFGHALHGLFSNIRYPTLGATPRDFVEMPSQFNEHWAKEPSVFANYAKHYKTGEPMPAALVEQIRRAREFNQGYATTEYVAAALLDLAWHTLSPESGLENVDAFEKAALVRYHVDLPEVPPRYRTTYFSHIWDLGYAAGYYAYLWSEVLDDDAYYWFKEHGGMTRENGDRFRKMVLSREGTQDVAVTYREFRGRDPEVGPLLEERGLKQTPKAEKP